MNSLNIIYQDLFLMVIDKPPGLIVTPTETDSSKTLSDILQNDYQIQVNRGGVVHRLDKNTSGLILVAKTESVLEKLQAQFQSRLVKKEYICLVHGSLEKEGVISEPIARNPLNREKFMVNIDGKEATTKYKPLKSLIMSPKKIEEIFEGFNKIQMRKLQTINYPRFTLVSCKPQTGRTHQIRVHLKYLGFPIVSDEKYGGRKIVRLDKRWCPRQFLHAQKIEFTHPETNKLISFEAALPADLENSLSLLEEVNKNN